MASGLPVLYSATGGTPELVDDAGVGVETPENWEQTYTPPPEEYAKAILHVMSNRDDLAGRARKRAVEHFGLCSWIRKHEDLFEQLLESR